MSVKERTAAIRMILTGSDTENWHMLETYLTETTEKDRTAIARSLGGMYGLYEAEGPADALPVGGTGFQPRVSCRGRLGRYPGLLGETTQKNRLPRIHARRHARR